MKARRRHFRILAWILAAAFLPEKSVADMYTVIRQGGTILPLESHDISMDAETVFIEPGEDGLIGKATFWMRNQTDKTIACTVAFPVLGHGYAGTTDINREFKVRLKNGADPLADFVPVVARLQVNRKVERDPAKEAGLIAKNDYPECVLWDVTWAPLETKAIEVVYEVGALASLPGSNEICAGTNLVYIVRTGALWKGPIGRADITFRGVTRLGVGRELISYPQTAHWNSPTELTWHFENWKPVEDISFKQVSWRPLSATSWEEYLFVLPWPYAGDSTRYTDRTIDDLVEKELVLAKEYFPAEVAAYDRAPLRRAIDAWLYHELFARHGDPFSIGKHVEGKPEPKGVHGWTEPDNNYIGTWRDHFDHYGSMKGWYRPRYNADGTPPIIELNPTERRNVEFLKTYLAKFAN